jgi:hypothetical protein
VWGRVFCCNSEWTAYFTVHGITQIAMVEGDRVPNPFSLFSSLLHWLGLGKQSKVLVVALIWVLVIIHQLYKRRQRGEAEREKVASGDDATGTKGDRSMRKRVERRGRT